MKKSSVQGDLKSNSSFQKLLTGSHWSVKLYCVTCSLTSTKCRHLVYHPCKIEHLLLGWNYVCWKHIYIEWIYFLIDLYWILLLPVYMKTIFFICRGLFITIHDRGHIATMLKSWPENIVKVSSILLAWQSCHCFAQRWLG